MIASSLHGFYLAAAIVGEIATAIGIVLESPREKTGKEWTGLVLVLGGVLVSAAFTIALFVYDEDISTAQQGQILKQQGQLSQQSMQLQSQNATIQREQARIDQSQVQIQTAQSTIARLTKRLTTVTGQLTRLEASRALTTVQIAKVAHLLRSAPRGATVAVSEPLIDSTDAKDFAASVRLALTMAGYQLASPPPKLANSFVWSSPGAWIFVHDLQKSPPGGRAIQNAFGAVGTYFPGMSRPDDVPDVNMLVIVVSSHPFKPVNVPAALLR